MKRNINLKINGMMCKHCAKRVEDALNSIKGVSKINIDLENKEVNLLYKGEDLEVFKSTIDEAGYELVSLEEK